MLREGFSSSPTPRKPSRLEILGAGAAMLGAEACATGNTLDRAAQQDAQHQEQENARFHALSPEMARQTREALRPWGEREDAWHALSVLRFALVEPGHPPTYYMTERIGTATDHYSLMKLIDGIRQAVSTLHDRVEQGVPYSGDDNTAVYVNRLARLTREVRSLPASDIEALSVALVQITQQERGRVAPHVAEMIARNLLPEDGASGGQRIPTVAVSPEAAPSGTPVQVRDERDGQHSSRHHRRHRNP